MARVKGRSAVENVPTSNMHYFVHIWGGVEPELYGPFASPEKRDEKARSIYESEDAICRLDIIDGVPTVWPYAHGELPGDDEDEDDECD